MIKLHWLELGQPVQGSCTNSQYFINRYIKTEWRQGLNSQHSVPLQQPLIILLPTLCRNLQEEHFRNFNFHITNQRPAFFFFLVCVFQQHQLKSQSPTALLCLQNWHEVLSENLAAGFEAKQNAAPFSQPPAVPCCQEQTPAPASQGRRCDSRTLREQICRLRRCYFYKVTLHCETTNVYRERKVLRQHFAELCGEGIPWAAGKGWLRPQAQQQLHIERWAGEKIKFAHDQIKKAELF